MGKIAVDIVILPPEWVNDLAISLNRKLHPKADNQINLNTDNCLPHISLAMGTIEQKKAEQMGKVLADIAVSFLPMELRIVGITERGNSLSEATTSLEIERVAALQNLHEEVMRTFGSFMNSDVSTEMLLGKAVSGSTLTWIRNYASSAAYRNFQPHITIGYGKLSKKPAMPIKFTAVQLAICQLGNRCTCVEVLA